MQERREREKKTRESRKVGIKKRKGGGGGRDLQGKGKKAAIISGTLAVEKFMIPVSLR